MQVTRIKVLDKMTANQIAAGEVIEAPSSVVKELVENSIDAGSSKINVKVEKGGIDLVVIQDNGIGMTKADLSLAFERHATSKINNSTDLNYLQTLGFRGEALPSIASVAKVTVVSKTEKEITGWQIVIEEGKVKTLVEKGCNTGTIVTVKDLFYNTPARKKYLKSPLTEMANITDIVSKLALAHPQISFNLTSNGRQVLKTPGTNNLIDVITCLWGVEMAGNLFYLSDTVVSTKLTGYLGKISYHRPNRKGQLFFVNHRFVKSKVITEGLEEGFRTLLPINRFPFAIINININPEEIDVNVHPTKLEVKFLNPDYIKNFIKDMVKKNIQNSISQVNSKKEYLLDEKEPGSKLKPEHNTSEEQISLTNYKPNDLSNDTLIEEAINNDFFFSSEQKFANNFLEKVVAYDDNSFKQHQNFEVKEVNESLIATLRFLGQLNKSYLVCEGKDGLYLVDQHAAHERIKYHKLITREKSSISSQQLLFPLNIDLSPSEVELVIENILKFREYGFILEHFGGTAFVIREVPQDLPQGEEKNCFYELLELFSQNANNPSFMLKERAITLLACKTAIKAGQQLSIAEIMYILEELSNTDNYFTCPHGRPTVISFDYNLISNKFLRK